MHASFLKDYLEQTQESKSEVIAFLASLDHLREKHPEIAKQIIQELNDQRSHLKLIASENYSSLSVQLAMGNLFTDKYAEGVAYHRFYAGCEQVDAIEEQAVQEAKALFGSDHAYVQPHSGADANLVAMWAFLIERVENKKIATLGKKSIDELTAEEYEDIRKMLVDQKVMGMGLGSGGHLTHGYRRNISSKIMKSVAYDVDRKTEEINYKELEAQVKKERPGLFIAGYSAYPRRLNFAKIREITDSVGAVLMIDMAHFAGLVAGGVFEGDFHPVPFGHLITSTSHKTLRGPRGGFVLCNKEFKETVDKGCPLVLGGPLPHVMAAKAVAFKEANTPAFKAYAHQIVANAKALAEGLLKTNVRLVTGGTDNHLMIADVAHSFGLNGKQAEGALRQAGFTVNRNAIAFDPKGAWYTSGIRLGTAALTTRGMKEAEMEEIGKEIATLLSHTKPASSLIEGYKSKVDMPSQALSTARQFVDNLLTRFPLYPEIPRLVWDK